MVGWIAAETWQSPRYSVVTNTISDMQAATAPHVWFPITCFAIGGLGSFGFVIFGLRPATAAAARVGISGIWALALSVLALGNSFPLIPCQLSDRACSAHHQLHSVGGMTDAIVASLAFLVLVFTPKALWPRLQLLPKWRSFAPIARIAALACPLAFVVLCAASLTNTDEGLAERVLVTVCALWLAALAMRHLAIARSKPDVTRAVAPGDWLECSPD